MQSILDGQGRSFSAAQSFIEDYTKDGLIPATNAITAYKNLAMRGYDDSQIQQVMAALKDASAFGRQASYTMGEAVESATEGLKNENSILVDNAGVTKNVAKMWEEFDELNRLQSDTGSGGTGGVTNGVVGGGVSTSIVAEAQVEDTISPKLQEIADKIKELVEPLKNIDFGAAVEAFERLSKAVSQFDGIIVNALEWAWYNILVPLKKWTIEEAGPAAVSTLASAYELLSAALEPVIAGLEDLFIALQPVFNFIGDVILFVLEKWQELFDDLARTFEKKGPKIAGIISDIGEILAAVWSVIEPILRALMEVWGEAFSYLSEATANSIGLAIDILYGIAEFLAGVFTGDWERAFNGLVQIGEGFGEATEKQFSLIQKDVLSPFDSWLSGVFSKDWSDTFGVLGDGLNGFFSSVSDTCSSIKRVFSGITTFLTGVFRGDWQKAWIGIQEIFGGTFEAMVGLVKAPANTIIGLINGLVSGVVSAINAVIRALNGFSFSIPDWVPSFGGKKLGFSIRTISCPTSSLIS